MTDTIRLPLATESHPSQDHHYVFSPECLDSMVEQAKGLPITINFDGDPRGTVIAAERTADGIMLEIRADCAIAPRIASPEFRANDQEWNGDFTERVIRSADLRRIGLTDE